MSLTAAEKGIGRTNDWLVDAVDAERRAERQESGQDEERGGRAARARGSNGAVTTFELNRNIEKCKETKGEARWFWSVLRRRSTMPPPVPPPAPTPPKMPAKKGGAVAAAAPSM